MSMDQEQKLIAEIADKLHHKILKTLDTFFKDNKDNKEDLKEIDCVHLAFIALNQTFFTLLETLDRKSKFGHEIRETILKMWEPLEALVVKIRADNVKGKTWKN